MEGEYFIKSNLKTIIQSLLILSVASIIMAACTKHTPKVLTKQLSTSNTISQSKPVEPDTSTANANPTNSSSSNPSDEYSVWVGEWKWDQTTKYDLSTISIKSVEDQQISFSLNAFHVTNHTTMDGHQGEIEGIAVLKGNEAVYKDDEFKFELRMKLVDGHLKVKTNNSDMFGAYVIVDGLYNRIHTTIKNDPLASTAPETSDIMIGEPLKDQSFHLDFDYLKGSEFITTIEEVDKVNVIDRPHFYIKTGGKISELKYKPDLSRFFNSVSAVSFRDVNSDGEKDIIVITDYFNGAGSLGSIPVSEVIIFKQTEAGFIEDTSIEQKAQDGVPYRMLSIQDVMIGLNTNPKNSERDAWRRLRSGTYKADDGSTLTIKQSSGDDLSFGIETLQSAKEVGADVGHIDAGKATRSYADMIYQKGKYELSFYLITDVDIYVSDNAQLYYGIYSMK
jgi:hypothetical protein